MDRNLLYEDIKVLLVNGNLIVGTEFSEDVDYIFAVRKEWLIDYLTENSNHPYRLVKDDELTHWLENEYTSEDSCEIYQAALFEGEVIFEGVKNCGGTSKVERNIYIVKEESRCDGEVEEIVYLRTTDKDEALARYEQEKDSLLKDDNFFLKDITGEERTRLTDGLPQVEFRDDGGDYYCLFVHRAEFTDYANRR